MRKILCFILSIILIMTSTIVIVPSETLATTSVTNFDYTGAVQTFTVPYNGLYTMEVWGAQGGTAYGSYEGGKGAYSKGTVELTAGTTLYVYVGGQGGATGTDTSKKVITGGFNGGGAGRVVEYNGTKTYASGGGGGTDIRIGQDSLYARVIVAGGGSGKAYSSNNYTGGAYYGGGATSGGYNSSYIATQTTGGTSGSFGQGASSASSNSSTEYKYVSPGAGGGWYGGGSFAGLSDEATDILKYTAGGSGYVYTADTASNYPSGCLLNSTYYLEDAYTIAGSESFTAPNGESETEHSGHGYVRITLFDEIPPTVTFSVNGATTYVATASTVVTVEDDSGVGVLKYQWTDSSTAPEANTFTLTFTNGDTLTLSGRNDLWYLWVYAEDIVGNSTIAGTDSFLLDGIAPEGEMEITSVVYEEDGMKFTNSNNLIISITNVSDNITSEANMKIALINENNFSFTNPNSEIEWLDYTSTINWQASSGDGLKRVYVIFKDEAGNQSLYLAR